MDSKSGEHGKQLLKSLMGKLSPGKWKKDQLLIVLLVGILFVVLALPTGKEGSADSGNEKADSIQDTKQTASTKGNESYAKQMEERLSEALSQVEGVGEVRVMITLKSTHEKVVEKDDQSTESTVEETDKEGGVRDTKETTSNRTSIYSQGENGRQTPYVSKELEPEISGILIIAQGGDNSRTVQSVTEAVMALFPVEAHKIKVMKMS